MDKIKHHLGNFAGAFFLLLALVAFAKEPLLAGISLLAIALIVTPFTARLINNKLSNRLTVQVRVVASVALFIVFASAVGKAPENAQDTQIAELPSKPLSTSDSALKWQKATSEDKLAVCKQMIEGAWRKDQFTLKIYNAVYDNMIGYSRYLCEQIDTAFSPQTDKALNEKTFTNQKVSEAAAMIMIMEGWYK